MRIQWTIDFSVYDEEIDSQHRDLFIIINKLDVAMRQGKAGQEILRVMDFLDQYAAGHFRVEEQQMAEHAFPGLESHRERHAWFRRQLSEIRKKLQSDGPTPDLIILADHLLITWFSNHIRTFDRMLGNFLSERRQAASGREVTVPDIG
ncbi:MAG: bacteriohemerythrin [Nitrospiraceae bacterium]|nr:bacteriohemerythrin [Nitrospiraceae bacterium]